MEKHNEESLETLINELESFDETTIDFLIHFVRVFEVYSEEVWKEATTKINAPKQILILGAKHPSWSVQICVARNLNTPSRILEILAGDEDGYTRESVASNPNTPVSILEILAEDEDRNTRGSGARNPNVPSCVLELLAEDGNGRVKAEAWANLRSKNRRA